MLIACLWGKLTASTACSTSSNHARSWELRIVCPKRGRESGFGRRSCRDCCRPPSLLWWRESVVHDEWIWCCSRGCEDGGTGEQEGECEDCDGEWVMCLHGEGYLGSG